MKKLPAYQVKRILKAANNFPTLANPESLCKLLDLPLDQVKDVFDRINELNKIFSKEELNGIKL